MIIEEKVREWQQECLTNYCQACSSTCCNSQKHRIVLEQSSLPLFQEYGIPVVKQKQLDKHSLGNNRPLLKDGSPVPKPSIIQTGRFLSQGGYLHADICPFYDKGKGCKVHEDSRRPQVCKDYPITFLGCNDEGRLLDVRIMRSCEYFNKPENRTALIERFPVRIIED